MEQVFTTKLYTVRWYCPTKWRSYCNRRCVSSLHPTYKWLLACDRTGSEILITMVTTVIR